MSPRIAWHGLLGFFKTITKLAVVLAILLGIGYGIRQAIEHTFHRNPDFQLQAINLNTNDVLDETALVEHLQIDLSANIFDFDLDAMQLKLLEIPAISSAKIERELPGTLAFELTTRVPIAWVSTISNDAQNSERLLVDKQGFAYPCPPMQSEDAEQLPVILLAKNEDYKIHARKIVKHPDYKYCVRLLEACRTTFPEEITLIESISRHNEWSLHLTTRTGTVATFGLSEHERQLESFGMALRHAQQKAYHIATINLIPKRNIPITISGEEKPPRAVPVSEEMLSDSDDSRRAEDMRSLLNRN